MKKFARQFEMLVRWFAIKIIKFGVALGTVAFWGMAIYFFGPPMFFEFFEGAPGVIRIAATIALLIFSVFLLGFLPKRLLRGLRDFALAVFVTPILFGAIFGAFDGLQYLGFVLEQRGDIVFAETLWTHQENQTVVPWYPSLAVFFGGLIGTGLFIGRIFGWGSLPEDSTWERPRNWTSDETLAPEVQPPIED